MAYRTEVVNATVTASITETATATITQTATVPADQSVCLYRYAYITRTQTASVAPKYSTYTVSTITCLAAQPTCDSRTGNCNKFARLVLSAEPTST
ncbi:uncharacterized protein BDZ83DRAFT_639279 [Colletotrichum acutatum]|uniref:Uncharacterized protein n=1 Tax=Glomerella acutata TaxID=27357 RepID=A0AAD8U848_GLOAC|nr:uncharacterized protein BDZ83DRAFT_639279 [Colletotrichum acutatum]KAK1711893.1 hypothetical protein BDZ83DRAFT_639279 [Colletotrichum acutatum]